MSDGRSPSRWSEGEWRLMHAVWAAAAQGGGATVREVRQALEPGARRAYSTVKTMLDRLVAKRALARRGRGVALEYRPLVEREAAQHRELEAFTAGVLEGRSEPLVHFLLAPERLGAADRKALERLLRRAGRSGPAEREA
jgi:BlaI family penicillinase repressor